MEKREESGRDRLARWGIIAGAVIVLVMYCLPWVHVTRHYYLPGYAVPNRMGDLVWGHLRHPRAKSLSVLDTSYHVTSPIQLVPLLAALAAYGALIRARRSHALAFGAAFGIVAAAILPLTPYLNIPGDERFVMPWCLGIGLYGTVVAALLMLMAPLIAVKRRQVPAAPQG